MKQLSSGTAYCYSALETQLSDLGSAALAFSGGIDSTLLLVAASKIPGLRLVAYTAANEFIQSDKVSTAASFAEKLGVKHHILDTVMLQIPEIAANDKNRCYYCKKMILNNIRKAANDSGIVNILEGSHQDDLACYRPGLKAISELKILSPLKTSGFNKQQIYELSQYFGLNPESMDSDSCLATRIPYNTQITDELLKNIDAAEKILARYGFRKIRARAHGDILRIEIAPEMIEKITAPDIRAIICKDLGKTGFNYITLDLLGYRSGSMDADMEINK